MKVNKDGSLKLNTNDIRIGNLVFTNETDYIKLQDISRGIVVSLKKNATSRAIALEYAIENNLQDTLEKYAYFIFFTNSIAIDGECLEKVIQDFNDCIERHKEEMGIKENISKRKDAKILKNVKKSHQDIESLKKELEMSID